MPTFYALVDAVPGRQEDVETSLHRLARITAVAYCRERSHDFLVRFEAASFGVVDDFLQSYVRPIPGVINVEIVQDFADYGDAVHAARDAMG